MHLRTAMLKAPRKEGPCEQLQQVNSKLVPVEDQAHALAEIQTANGLKTRQQIDEEFEGLKRCVKAQLAGIRTLRI